MSLTDLVRRMSRKAARSTTQSAQNHNRRLGVEPLEARDNPSPVWTDATGDHLFNDAVNWDNGIVPTENDYVMFKGTYPGSTDDCYGMSGIFYGVSLEADYTGTVTFSGPVTVSNYFFMANGIIDQPADGD